MRPACLLVGHEHDPTFSVQGRRDAAARIPDSSLVIVDGVSHVALDPSMTEHSRAAILAFLASH